MMRLLVQIFLSALAFIYILPLINGISVHGGLGAAIGMAIFFGLMVFVVDVLAVAFSAFLAVGTLGLALLWLIPIWVLGFWVLPAVALLLVSNLMPSYLTVHGWIPAIFGSLVLMVISMVTSGSMHKTVLGSK